MPASRPTYHNASWYCIAGGCPATMAKESRDPEIGVASTGPGTGQGRAGQGALHDHARPLRLPVLHEGGSDDYDDAPGAPTAQGAPECARRGPRNHVITTRHASKQNLQKFGKFSWQYASARRLTSLVSKNVEIRTCSKAALYWSQTKTRSSAIAEGPRDASCQLKSCQMPRNSADTSCTTSPEPSIRCR